MEKPSRKKTMSLSEIDVDLYRRRRPSLQELLCAHRAMLRGSRRHRPGKGNQGVERGLEDRGDRAGRDRYEELK